jgi:hypothetical protein
VAHYLRREKNLGCRTATNAPDYVVPKEHILLHGIFALLENIAIAGRKAHKGT